VDSAGQSFVGSPLLMAAANVTDSVQVQSKGGNALSFSSAAGQAVTAPGQSFAAVIQGQQQFVDVPQVPGSSLIPTVPNVAQLFKSLQLQGQNQGQGQFPHANVSALTIGNALPLGGESLPAEGLVPLNVLAKTLVQGGSNAQNLGQKTGLETRLEASEELSAELLNESVFIGPFVPVSNPQALALNPVVVAETSTQMASVILSGDKAINPMLAAEGKQSASATLTLASGESVGTADKDMPSATVTTQYGSGSQSLTVSTTATQAPINNNSLQLDAMQQTIKPLLEQVDSLITADKAKAHGLENAIQHASSVALPRLESLHAYREPTASSWQTEVPVTVGKPGWSEAVTQRVMWMSSQQVRTAEIALDPPELGPLQVRINSQSDQTSVVFTSQHAAVREALDQSLPRLREMLEEQGIDLADVDVSDQSLQRHDAEAEEPEIQQNSSGDEALLADEQVVEEQLLGTSIGLIDERV
jgi:flagellar hook-length control protein FliK